MSLYDKNAITACAAFGGAAIFRGSEHVQTLLPEAVPALCRALYEAAGLEWPADDRKPTEDAQKNRQKCEPCNWCGGKGWYWAAGPGERHTLKCEVCRDCRSPDPDRARVLAEAGADPSFAVPVPECHDPGFAKPLVPCHDAGFHAALDEAQRRSVRIVSAPPAPDLTDLKEAGCSEYPADDAKTWAAFLRIYHRQGKNCELLPASCEMIAALLELTAGLRTEDKPEDALEVARKALEEAAGGMEYPAEGFASEKDRADFWCRASARRRDAARSALSALQRAKGGVA